MSEKIKTLQHILKQEMEDLALIEERMSEYVLSTDVPLLLVKEQRRLRRRIRRLKRRIEELRPIHILREATKMLTGAVARQLTGEPWKHLHQRLLTQASRLPHSSHLDVALLEAEADNLSELVYQLRILLEAYRIEPTSGQMEAIKKRADRLASILSAIYRLGEGEVPEFANILAV